MARSVRSSARELKGRLRSARARLGPRRPIVDRVEAWCAGRPDLECRVLVPRAEVQRSLPRTVEATMPATYADRTSASLRDKILVAIPGARIVGEHGLVVLPDGAYAAESAYTSAVLEADADYAAPPRRPVVPQPGGYVSLLNVWPHAVYYHWMHDVLERLYRVLAHVPDDVRYLVPAGLRPYQVETLELLGIPESRLVRFDGSEVWELETLHFTTATTNSGSSRREVDEWLRDSVMRAYGIERSAAPHRRLYLSRRDVATRRLANEAEVEALLHGDGFETCRPEQLSLREQVALFAETEIVISGHGSAFTNMLFAPPGLVVVDMVEASMADLAYVFWTMCEALGHEYWFFSIDSVARPGQPPDGRVPLEKLRATLDGIGRPPRPTSARP